jgi:hypothetical protein
MTTGARSGIVADCVRTSAGPPTQGAAPLVGRAVQADLPAQHRPRHRLLRASMPGPASGRGPHRRDIHASRRRIRGVRSAQAIRTSMAARHRRPDIPAVRRLGRRRAEPCAAAPRSPAPRPGRDRGAQPENRCRARAGRGGGNPTIGAGACTSATPVAAPMTGGTRDASMSSWRGLPRTGTERRTPPHALADDNMALTRRSWRFR